MHVREMVSTHPHVQGNTADQLLKFIEEAYDCAQTCTSCADACLAEEVVAELAPVSTGPPGIAMEA